MDQPLYLDDNATTPGAPEVADAIEPYLHEHFGNPSSSHVYGRRAHDAVARARGQVAGLIGAGASEIVFTGCATEANNLAVLDVAALDVDLLMLTRHKFYPPKGIGALYLRPGTPIPPVLHVARPRARRAPGHRERAAHRRARRGGRNGAAAAA